MPKGGHNRKPRNQKIIEGTFRPDRNPQNEPEAPPLSDIPKPPSGLNRWARRAWKALAPRLVTNGMLTELDLFTFEACCIQYGIAKECEYRMTHWPIIDPETREKIGVKKQTLTDYLYGRTSQTQTEYTAMRQAYAQFKTYLELFGLSPVSRNRIDLPQGGEKDQDPMERLLHEA